MISVFLFCVKYLTFCNFTCECLISGFLMGSMLLLVSCLQDNVLSQSWLSNNSLVGASRRYAVQGRGGDGHLTTRHQIKPVTPHLFFQGSQCVQSQLYGWLGANFKGQVKVEGMQCRGDGRPTRRHRIKPVTPRLTFSSREVNVYIGFHKANYGWLDGWIGG